MMSSQNKGEEKAQGVNNSLDVGEMFEAQINNNVVFKYLETTMSNLQKTGDVLFYKLMVENQKIKVLQNQLDDLNRKIRVYVEGFELVQNNLIELEKSKNRVIDILEDRETKTRELLYSSKSNSAWNKLNKLFHTEEARSGINSFNNSRARERDLSPGPSATYLLMPSTSNRPISFSKLSNLNSLSTRDFSLGELLKTPPWEKSTFNTETEEEESKSFAVENERDNTDWSNQAVSLTYEEIIKAVPASSTIVYPRTSEGCFRETVTKEARPFECKVRGSICRSSGLQRSKHLASKQLFSTTMCIGELKAMVPTERPFVPRLVACLIKEIELRVADCKLYKERLPESEVKLFLKEKLKVKRAPRLMEVSNPLLCSSLVGFFRYLQEPLVSSLYLGKLLKTIVNKEKNSKELNCFELLSKLHPAHKDTLSHIVLHLKRISLLIESKPKELAEVFGPSLMWCSLADKENEVIKKCHVVEIMQQFILFPNSFWTNLMSKPKFKFFNSPNPTDIKLTARNSIKP